MFFNILFFRFYQFSFFPLYYHYSLLTRTALKPVYWFHPSFNIYWCVKYFINGLSIIWNSSWKWVTFKIVSWVVPRFVVRSLVISVVHSVFCLTTGPKHPPKRYLHIVRRRASFKWEYPLLSLISSSSFLRFLPRLLATSISSFIFPSITCFRMQFLRKMWPIQLAFLFLISCRIFLCSLTLSNTWRNMSIKNSSDTIENRTCDLPACSSVSQQLLNRLLRVVSYSRPVWPRGFQEI